MLKGFARLTYWGLARSKLQTSDKSGVYPKSFRVKVLAQSMTTVKFLCPKLVVPYNAIHLLMLYDPHKLVHVYFMHVYFMHVYFPVV